MYNLIFHKEKKHTKKEEFKWISKRQFKIQVENKMLFNNFLNKLKNTLQNLYISDHEIWKYKLEMYWKSYDKAVWFTETVIYSNLKTKKSYDMYYPLCFISISLLFSFSFLFCLFSFLFCLFWICFFCVSIVLGGATIQNSGSKNKTW